MLEMLFALGGMALVFASIAIMKKGVTKANVRNRVLGHVAMFMGVFAITLVVGANHVFAEEASITGTLAQGLGFIGAALVTGCSCIGAGIAVAFVATVYGVGAANLILIPFSTKLKTKFKKVFLKKEMIIEGILSIQAGESPALIERKLQAYILDSHMREEEK